MKLFKAMATVAALTSVSRVAGFVRDLMTAAFIGAGPMSDAFFVALKLPNFFRRVTAEGAFTVSFVPVYSETLEREDQDAASRLFGNVFMIMLIGLGIFTILAIAAMPWVIHVIAPGFGAGEERYDLAVEYTRITFPYLILMSLSALLGGALNAQDRFAPFAIAPALFNVCLILALLLRDMGETPGHVMSWAITISGVLQLLWLYASARRAGIRFKLVRPRFTNKIKKIFKLMGPGILGAGVIQINLFADMVIASFMGAGAISHMYYADRLNQLPLGLIGVAVGTALLPMLSRAMARQDWAESQSLFNRSLELCLLLALPAAAALMVMPLSIITVLFERGAFTAADSLVTSGVLAAYAFGLPSYIAAKVFSSAHWARHDTMTPVKISVVVTITNIALSLVLIRFMGVAGIAMAMGITGWLQVVLYMRSLKDHPAAQFDDRFKHVAPRIALASAAMTAVLLALHPFVADYIMGESSLLQVTGLGALIGAAGAVYGGFIFGTGVLKIHEIRGYFRRA